MSILIVDDSLTTRLLLQSFLEGAGYSDFVMAQQGGEALDVLSRDQGRDVELVIMDIDMPGMDGIEVTRRIKSSEQSGDIPIIIVTASDEEETLAQAFAAGAIDFITKPVSRTVLRARTAAVLKMKQEADDRLKRERDLLDMAKRLSRAKAELEDANQHLEERVEERTTELMRAYEELKELDRLKMAFLTNVSHELRTPLTSVLGFAARIRSKLKKSILPALGPACGDGGEPAHKAAVQSLENIGIIIAEAEGLTDRIRDILDFIQIESGNMEWKDRDVDMAEITRLAVESVSPQAREKGIRLDYSAAKELPFVWGDRDRLEQAVGNLVSNAVKFTNQGTVLCDVALDNERIVVSIRDTGHGFPVSEYGNVFEKFQQIGDVLTDKPRGTGLGVPLSTLIVQRHGGDIWAESKPGQGSTFFLAVPVK